MQPINFLSDDPETADELQATVEQARAEYERARESAEHIVGATQSGAHIREALEIQRLATERYARALKALTDYVLGSKTSRCA